jgi:hypothetical protein
LDGTGTFEEPDGTVQELVTGVGVGVEVPEPQPGTTAHAARRSAAEVRRETEYLRMAMCIGGVLLLGGCVKRQSEASALLGHVAARLVVR